MRRWSLHYVHFPEEDVRAQRSNAVAEDKGQRSEIHDLRFSMKPPNACLLRLCRAQVLCTLP